MPQNTFGWRLLTSALPPRTANELAISTSRHCAHYYFARLHLFYKIAEMSSSIYQNCMGPTVRFKL